MKWIQKLSNAIAPVRILGFAVGLGIWWGVTAAGLNLIWGTSDAVTIATMVIFYAGFVGLLWVWGRHLHHQTHPLRFYGWDFRRTGWREILIGWFCGTGLVFGLFGLQGGVGWVHWQGVPAGFAGIMASGGVVAAIFGCAEELVFRGWLLQELEQDYPGWRALGINSVLFAILHFLRPLEVILKTWPQFLGLLLLGIILVLCRRLCWGRLSLAIGFHSGLVWGYYLIRVGELAKSTQRVPTWVTGIDDNPLAGVLGVGLLIAVTVYLQRLHQRQLSQQQLHRQA